MTGHGHPASIQPWTASVLWLRNYRELLGKSVREEPEIRKETESGRRMEIRKTGGAIYQKKSHE
jgi:hypothetical protein